MESLKYTDLPFAGFTRSFEDVSAGDSIIMNYHNDITMINPIISKMQIERIKERAEKINCELLVMTNIGGNCYDTLIFKPKAELVRL